MFCSDGSYDHHGNPTAADYIRLSYLSPGMISELSLLYIYSDAVI